MTVKNKDGSAFRLRGPNPLMKKQDIWTDFIVHNFKFKNETIEDTTEVHPHDSDFQVKDFVQELEATKPEPVVEQSVALIEKQVQDFYNQESNQQESKPFEKEVVVMPDKEKEQEEEKKPVFHCLPAVLNRHRDVLYGETYATIKYDAPFTFEALVVDQSDMVMQFWTSGSATDKINEGAVLYPKIGEKRWWRVSTKTQHEGGWLYQAIPSDYQPNFK